MKPKAAPLDNSAPKPKRKYKPRNHLTPKQWMQIRAIYEIGESNKTAICEAWSISESQFEKHCANEKWTERRLSAEIKKKTEDSTVEMFARLGMPKEELLKLVLSGAQSTKMLKNVKQPMKRIKNKDGKPFVVDRTVKVEDNETTLKYRQEIAKLCGFYAPPKQAVDSAPTIPEDIMPIHDDADIPKWQRVPEAPKPPAIPATPPSPETPCLDK